MIILVQGVGHVWHLSRQHFGGRDNYTAQHSAADGMEEAKAESRAAAALLPFSALFRCDGKGDL